MVVVKIVLGMLIFALVLWPLEFPPPGGISQEEYLTYKQYVEARLKAIEDATDVRASNLESRLQSVNEFRGQLTDQAATLITRTEVESEVESIKERITKLELSKAELEGKASQAQLYVAWAIGLAGLMVALFKKEPWAKRTMENITNKSGI